MTRWSSSDAPRGAAYDERFARLAASGHDVHGEASFVMGYRPKSVLDAGCGTGRVAIELARRGVTAVGVDLDLAMLDQARAKAPELRWVSADLAELSLQRANGESMRFQAIVCAGNVMIFLARGSEGEVISRLAEHLVPGGLLISGFQLTAGRLSLEEYDDLCTQTGLVLFERFASWDRTPWTGSGGYAVSVHQRPGGADAQRG